jgi:hypothetical protein
MTDRLPQTQIQFATIEYHLSGMDSLDGSQWYREFAGVFDVNYQFGPAIGGNFTYRTNCRAAIGHERLIFDLDEFMHVISPN